MILIPVYNAVHTSSFSVDQSVEMDCTILSCFGLKDFISKEAMYEYVCENLHLDLDEVDGTEPLIIKQGNKFILVCDRGFPSDIEDPSIYNYLSNYIQ